MSKFSVLQVLLILILLTGCDQIIDRTLHSITKSDKIKKKQTPIYPTSKVEISEKGEEFNVNHIEESLSNDLQARKQKNLLIPEIRNHSNSDKTRLNVIGINKDGPYRSDISNPKESGN